MTNIKQLIEEYNNLHKADIRKEAYLIGEDVLYNKLKNAKGREIIVKDPAKSGTADGRYLIYG
jgi:hypothetical protein